MEKLPATTAFVKPYFIAELGCEGLTNYDIAKALNRPVKHINQKIQRAQFQECCKLNQYDLITSSVTTVTSQKKQQMVYMSARAAKALVAIASWKEGYRYLDFLFDCEAAATKELPRLRQRIAELESKPKKLKGKSRAGMALVPEPPENLLAAEYALAGAPHVWKPVSETTPFERELGQYHRAKCLERGWKMKREAFEDKLATHMYRIEMLTHTVETVEQKQLN